MRKKEKVFKEKIQIIEELTFDYTKHNDMVNILYRKVADALGESEIGTIEMHGLIKRLLYHLLVHSYDYPFHKFHSLLAVLDDVYQDAGTMMAIRIQKNGK